jgi:hypothetical protein
LIGCEFVASIVLLFQIAFCIVTACVEYKNYFVDPCLQMAW